MKSYIVTMIGKNQSKVFRRLPTCLDCQRCFPTGHVSSLKLELHLRYIHCSDTHKTNETSVDSFNGMQCKKQQGHLFNLLTTSSRQRSSRGPNLSVGTYQWACFSLSSLVQEYCRLLCTFKCYILAICSHFGNCVQNLVWKFLYAIDKSLSNYAGFQGRPLRPIQMLFGKKMLGSAQQSRYKHQKRGIGQYSRIWLLIPTSLTSTSCRLLSARWLYQGHRKDKMFHCSSSD